LNPQWRPEIYLEGAIHRRDTLSREHQGPRAVWNAVTRLAQGDAGERTYAERDLALAQTQLRDYHARQGKPFTHDGYLKQLADLRDHLRIGLSGIEQEGVAEIAGKIKALRAANAVEAAPERTAGKKVSAEEPVTSRIRRKAEAQEPEDDGWKGRVGERNGWRK
jgi:hypothetical protein